MKDKKDLIIVIRTNRERTVDLCKSICLDVMPDKNIFVISESPFIKAVVRTFEIASLYPAEYVIGLDADIILFPDAIDYMLYEAEKMSSKSFFRIDFPIYDKFRGRVTGVHFYNNRYSESFLEFLLKNSSDGFIRPEYNNVKKFCEENNLSYQNIPHYIVGKHDYFQYYKDLYRKYLLRAKRSVYDKNADELRNNIKLFMERFIDDYDYIVVMNAFDDGIKGNIFKEDICQYLGIKEKSRLTDDEIRIIKNNIKNNKIMKKVCSANKL